MDIEGIRYVVQSPLARTRSAQLVHREWIAGTAYRMVELGHGVSISKRCRMKRRNHTLTRFSHSIPRIMTTTTMLRHLREIADEEIYTENREQTYALFVRSARRAQNKEDVVVISFNVVEYDGSPDWIISAILAPRQNLLAGESTTQVRDIYKCPMGYIGLNTWSTDKIPDLPNMISALLDVEKKVELDYSRCNI